MNASRPADGAPARLRLPDPSGLTPAGFSALVLAILVAATWLGARGLEANVDLRERLRAAELKAGSTSPLPYRAAVPATHALLEGRVSDGPRVAVRADSAANGEEGDRLCALAGSAGDAQVPLRWVALSGAVPPCLDAAAVAAPGPGVAAEWGEARWMLLDADGRVRHSARSVPNLAQVNGTITTLLASGPTAPSTPTPARP